MRRPGLVEVVGFISEAKGIGEAARLYAGALTAVGVPLRGRPVTAGASPRIRSDRDSAPAVPDGPSVSLICMNPPELSRYANAAFCGRQLNIGVWAWEVDRVPDEWAEAADPLDEVWVYSSYVAQHLSRAIAVPVIVLPLPVAAAPLSEVAEAQSLVFLSMFDFHSTIGRKNPLGVLEAFCRAFRPGEGPRLVLKSMNGEHHPRELEAIQGAAGARPDIDLIDRYMTDEEKNDLIAECGCFVSLHRSEGFGLGLAEAMSHGKPVIATGYSGNMDFMTTMNSYPVDYRLAKVPRGNSIYPAGATWGEPDIDHAAARMRQVWQNRGEAIERGRAARADIRRDLSFKAVGRLARARLELSLSRKAV